MVAIIMVSIPVLLFELQYSFPQQRRNRSGRAEGITHIYQMKM
jgi:hypothetical protein